ncbi:MAG: hypothetical protein NTY77_12840 [Elusimicrobia bacterium]|nr:hypothetical protein [Elusimicrobiota bacterium]
MTNMAVFLQSRELIALAIHIEESGRQAYEYFESRAVDEKLRSLWALLKGEESAHSRCFEDMLRALPSAAQTASGAPEGFARAVASSYVFTERRLAKVLLEDVSTDLDALAYGVYIEKESIFTYITLKDHLPPGDLPIVDRIIEEEKRHLVKLAALIESIRSLEDGA